MRRHNYLVALVIVLAALFWLPGFTQDSQKHEGNPSTLDKYDSVARGKMSRDRGIRPGQIARMDNNGEILLTCLDAKTAEQLNSTGIMQKQSNSPILKR